MTGLGIDFTNPWLLLLLIPALALVLWLYFRLSKKYRRTRNRVISVVLQVIVLVLSASVLAGAALTYEKPNLTNEVILLVDVSHSNRDSDESKSKFIKEVLEESSAKYQVGIVIFAKGQQYASPFGTDSDKIYRGYSDALMQHRSNPARLGDNSTDLASALSFAEGLFTDSESGKIVVISDGIETDGSAAAAILNLKVTVDAVHFPDDYGDEVMIKGITMPEYNFEAGEEVKIGISVISTYTRWATAILIDNGVESASVPIMLRTGDHDYELAYTFPQGGPHEVCITIEGVDDGDTVKQNNVYYKYIDIKQYNKILIVQKGSEAARLTELMETNYFDDYNYEAIDISDVPTTLSALSQYDQVILMNISNSDMPEGFDEILFDYVFNLGGGLLTVGGNKMEDGEEVSNVYNREDMNPLINGTRVPTLYQQMLPVDCIDYRPPLALMLVIDRSGSMIPPFSQVDPLTGKTRMDLAKDGAIACVNELSDQDYVGVISFAGDDEATLEIGLTPATNKSRVLNKIQNIEADGGTIYQNAIQKAGEELRAITNVENKHIIFVSDGKPNDDPAVEYENEILLNTASGITMTVIGITGDGLATDDGLSRELVEKMAELGKGRPYFVSEIYDLPQTMRDELFVPEITELVDKPYVPRLRNASYEANGLAGAEMPELGGYYGVRAKEGAEVPLMGEYTPLYAKWKVGNGKVGSFMSTLNGDNWSNMFLDDETGAKFINNAIKWLFPTSDISIQDIEVEYRPDNYTTYLTIKTEMPQGAEIEVTVNGPQRHDGTLPLSQKGAVELTAGFPKASFVFTDPGTYELIIEKRVNGQVSRYVDYLEFSYSAEYNVFEKQKKPLDVFGLEFLEAITKNGRGAVISIEAPADVFRQYYPYTTISKDLRIPFIITAIILFLLDIAIRKFKFKWPWEIVRDKKLKKALKKGNQ